MYVHDMARENRKTNKRVTLLAAICATLVLGACSGGEVKRSLGLDRQAPDEFMVLARPSLDIPPDFNLRPPSATSRISEKNRKSARKAVFKNSAGNNKNTDAAEGLLLRKSGADIDNSGIREVIAKENEKKNKPYSRESGFFDKVADSLNFSEKEPLVDAKAEKARIEKNKAEGKPITDGETPTIGSSDRGILNELID